MIEALVRKEKRCDSHYLGFVGKICIDLKHKSTVFWLGEVFGCVGKPCVTKMYASCEPFCPILTFLRIIWILKRHVLA